jgi:predicted GNAT superfamily acetyltransferase
VTTHVQLREDADESARVAAHRLGLRIVELTDASSHHAAADLLQRVWRADSPDRVMNAALMTALAYAGNYVAGAYQGEEMIAAAVGFFGVGQLHSHITGVDRATRVRGVGFALKQHQRAWALSRGITEVCWTFDPLVGRNAYFNLHKLGASATTYLPDFYGALDDGINQGDPTDRFHVSWQLESPAATEAARGHPVDLHATRFASAMILVDRAGDLPAEADVGAPHRGAPNAGAPHAGAPYAGGLDTGRPLLVAVPEDVEALRSRDPAAAARWRYAVRRAVQGAMAAGYRVEGISRDGFYALAVPERP